MATEINPQVDQLTATLMENDFRLTHARRTIIECLVECGGHVTADDLSELVRAASPHVGRATVFRTLELLSELGLIWPIYQGTGAAHYVLMDKGSHHHLICTKCHRVIEFDQCGGYELALRLGEQFSFQVQSHLFEIYGVCQDCS